MRGDTVHWDTAWHTVSGGHRHLLPAARDVSVVPQWNVFHEQTATQHIIVLLVSHEIYWAQNPLESCNAAWHVNQCVSE